MWITFNEPAVVVWHGNGAGVHAPGIKDPLHAPFKVAHSLLKSHARAYKVYKEEIKPKFGGKCANSIQSSIF